jgi:hypothetical protein
VAGEAAARGVGEAAAGAAVCRALPVGPVAEAGRGRKDGPKVGRPAWGGPGAEAETAAEACLDLKGVRRGGGLPA